VRAMSGTTGQRNQRSGVYRPNCGCGYEIALSEGETFPPCRNVHGPVTWTLVRATTK